MLLEEIERDIIRYSSFEIVLTGTEKSLKIECDLQSRGKLSVYVERRNTHWTMTDSCATVRRYGWMWNRHPDDIAEICLINTVNDTFGELWMYIDSESVFMSLCCVLCAMLEVEERSNKYRKMNRRENG